MINESVVCLDRRIVSPAAIEAGGVTTWTLPYSVAVDGSQGRVAVVRLDTDTELEVTRQSDTTVSAAGSFSGVPVAIGIAYLWRYVPTTIYMVGPSGQPDRRSAVQLSYVRAFLSGTRELDGTVNAPERPACTVQLRTAAPTEGQTLTLPVFADSKTATLELSTESPWPVRIGSMEWEGQFNPRSVTQVP